MSDTSTQSPTQTPEPITASPKLPARFHTDSLNPAHTNSPLGVRQIRIILLHPNLTHRTQCLTPEPITQSPTRHQNPTPEPITTSPKLPARFHTDSLNPAHINSPLGVRQIRSILSHPSLTHRTQCLTPEPSTQNTRTQSPTQTPQPKTPYQSLNHSRPALKTKNPATEIAGFFLGENPLVFLTKPTENKQTSDTRQ